ncbi:hypothetical protein [Orientia tsutsugamushi]|uniref:hypothetical protein n=1 Tax=Orientia tsutsugamushi TaxID=784 RepID=UPI0002EA1A3D|nr:hypothetical protein [Orientia tsutsugamushi]
MRRYFSELRFELFEDDILAHYSHATADYKNWISYVFILAQDGAFSNTFGN